MRDLTFSEAIDAISREELCTNYLTKSKSGLYCCPFCGSGTHKSKTGALKFYQQTNTYTCHACNTSGRVFDLYMQEHGCGFSEAVKDLSEKHGIIITGSRAQAPQQKTERQAREQTKGQQQKDYTAYYETCAERLHGPEGKEAREYLRSRGISELTAKACNLGYDPEADPAEAGHPSKRIIIPASAYSYTGRAIDCNIEPRFKALNNKGGPSDVFNMRAFHTKGVKIVFITEGAFDALSVMEISGEQAVAIKGAGNRGRLLEDLERNPTKCGVIVCLDNDPDPKTRATIEEHRKELLNGLRTLGIKCISYDLNGEYKDINEALTGNPQELAAAIQRAKKEIYRDDLTEFTEKIQTEAYRPYKTGLKFFDDLLGGGILQQSLLLLLAAPATGKTTLCQQIAEAMAENKKPVIYLNLEMSREQMIAKTISSRLTRKGAPTTAAKVLQGYSWTEDERPLILSEIEEYRQTAHRYIKYNPDGIGTDIEQINKYLTMQGEKAKRGRRPAPAVIVDYLHLLTTDKPGTDAQELIKKTVVILKDYAKNYDTFVIAISATNRASNSGGRITMESGRDSSALEYTGDYQVSLNYFDIDSGEVKTTDAEKIARLQGETYRRMILRVLKGRLCLPGKSANVYFHAAGNAFYSENDFMPVDAGATPFSKGQKVGGKTAAPGSKKVLEVV